MAEAGDVPVGPLTATLLTGGRSNLTYQLDDGTSSWVLRTPPRHGRTPSAHDVAREFTVTRALVGTDVPVAHPVLLCTDEAVLGVPFTVTRFVSGAAVRSSADLDALDDADIAAVIGALVDALAVLHSVDHIAVGLEKFGRPTGYAQRQIKRWTQQWSLVGDPTLTPLARELSDRLAAIDFVEQGAGIVHGDYRIDNTLLTLGAGGARVEAIVDWELSTIGDPTADVAMMCVYRHPALDLVLGTPSAWASPRLPDADTVAGAYERATGKPLRDWDAHMALGYFKLGVIAAGIDHRYRAGATHGPGFQSAAVAVPELLKSGLDRL
ncbi:phosphotransferase family protein [Mycolicibacterium sp.]|uniref:phosphotransferase family protein n=1 Tax=Mycolicibacterium sp. TaxID=2320850 RepID=UPI003D0DE0D7